MMNNNTRLFILIMCAFGGNSTSVTAALNLNFIKNTKNIPSILSDDVPFPKGDYIVDIVVNGEHAGRSNVSVSEEEEKKHSLCFTQEWLHDVGINVNLDNYKDEYDDKKGCYNLVNNKHTRVVFDYPGQKLLFNIPQAYLIDKTDPSHWDYGVNAGRIAYSGNFNKTSSADLDAFGNVDIGLNIGRWVLSSNLNASRLDDKSEVSSSDITLSTAVSALQGDFILGKSQTRTELFNDFNFYGAALRSNTNMRPWESRGYAPEISGIATSQSRITVKQNGYIVYSRVVPAGPYKLDDLRASGNGDMEVIVEDENGYKTRRFYPVTTLPTLLRAGEFRYNIASGKKNNSNKINKAFSSDAGGGVFVLGSLDYGLSAVTLNTAAILNDNYQALGVGATKSLGEFGAVSTGATVSKAQYDNGEDKEGQSISIKYAKSFAAQTELQLLAYQYRSKGYVEFSDYRPDSDFLNDGFNDSRRSRYEARLSRQLNNAYISGSYWQQNYWNRSGKDSGATLSLSTNVINSVSLFLNSSYSKQRYTDKSDYTVSLGMSIPFDFKGKNYYSNSSVDYTRNNGSSFSTGVSSVSGERLNYGVNMNASSRGWNTLTANASYDFDAMQTNFSLSQSHQRHGDSQTSISGGIAGTVLGTGESGVIFTKETTGTIGIVNLPDVKGVSFNGSAPTNKNGTTVVSLSEYRENDISVSMDNVPDNLELERTSFKVVPTENAVIYKRFGTREVLRYILRIKNRQGEYIDGGNALTEHGIYAGFVATNGVLLMNLQEKPEKIKIESDDGNQCNIAMGAINPGANKVQEVICE
ncbi:PefC/AfrB family outer membrane usher protein [Escherichia coli]